MNFWGVVRLWRHTNFWDSSFILLCVKLLYCVLSKIPKHYYLIEISYYNFEAWNTFKFSDIEVIHKWRHAHLDPLPNMLNFEIVTPLNLVTSLNNFCCSCKNEKKKVAIFFRKINGICFFRSKSLTNAVFLTKRLKRKKNMFKHIFYNN